MTSNKSFKSFKEGPKEKMERRVARRAKREKIQTIVLGSLLAITALGMVAAGPNALQLLRHVEKFIGPKPKLNRRISQSVTRLIVKGLVERKESRNGIALFLTQKGKQLAELLESEQHALPQKPRRWDKKWRIVIFDVWERRRRTRDQLRSKLAGIGFMKIQDSVWVYPYPCEDFFTFLRTDLRLGRGMLYIVAEEIENDRELRRHFDLSED